MRRSSAEPRSDLLAMSLAARDEETGNGLSDQLLRDEMMTLLSAGHETVSDAMTWTFYELMRHPDLYDRLLEEADREPQSTMPPSDGGTGESFAGMAFQEGLRLYPPGWGFLRAAIEQDAILLSFRIPAGSRLILSPYVIHRDPAIWDEPDRFDPDRFSSGQTAERHRFAWFPFSGGPRQCIGAGLAMMEAQMTLLGVSQAVRLQLEPGQTIRPLPRVSRSRTARSGYAPLCATLQHDQPLLRGPAGLEPPTISVRIRSGESFGAAVRGPCTIRRAPGALRFGDRAPAGTSARS